VTTLLHTMMPIVGLMALGVAAARLRVLNEAGVKGLVLFVFNFSIPALLLTGMADLELRADLEWDFLVAFYAASFATYGLGVALAAIRYRRPLEDQAIFGMGAGFSNLVLLGLPVVITALGPEAMLPLLIVIGLHSATFMPLTVLMIQAGRDGGGPGGARVVRLLAEILRNPIVIGILIGLLVNATGAPLWTGLATMLDLLGAAAIPCALFAMGASLTTYPLAGEAGPALALSALKLVVHPLLVWAIAVPVLGGSGIAVTVAVLLAAMPSAVNVYLFGARYEAAADVAARTVLFTTVCSMITVSVALALLGN